MTERFRTYYTILPVNVSDMQIIQDAEKKEGWLCGKHIAGYCLGPWLTHMVSR